jgi:hypothetical protein
MNSPSGGTGVLGIGQLNLDSVDAVDAVNEEDEDKDEGNLWKSRLIRKMKPSVAIKAYLHAILDLGHDRVLRNEGEETTLQLEGQRDDQGRKERHFEHQKCENLGIVSFLDKSVLSDQKLCSIAIASVFIRLHLVLDARSLLCCAKILTRL